MVDMTASALLSDVSLGTALGLSVGKPLGIFTFAWVAIRTGVSPAPGDSAMVKLLGASMVAGIGFTVALFVAALAFQENAALLPQAKVGILAGSLLSGALGSTASLEHGPNRGA